MKLFLDTKARRFVKSAASNVALQTLHLKRRDQVPIEIVFVSNNAVVAAPAGTTTAVGLKAKFSDANFLAYAPAGTATLDLFTQPVETAFASNPASLPALLEVRWSAPGESLRTATLQVELQNSVILGTEGTPAAAPDLKATQAEAEAGTSNEKWMTPLRTAQAIAELAPPTTDASLLTSGTLADARLSAATTDSLARAATALQPDSLGGVEVSYLSAKGYNLGENNPQPGEVFLQAAASALGVSIRPASLTDDRVLITPDSDGTLALTPHADGRTQQLFFTGISSPASTLGRPDDYYLRRDGSTSVTIFRKNNASQWEAEATLATSGAVTAATQSLSSDLDLKADLVSGIVPTTQLPPISYQTTRHDGDGTTFSFAPPGTLTASDSPSAVSVTVNGVTQEPGSDFTLNTATNRVVLSSALPLGDKIVITRPILLPSNSTLTAEQLGALTATSVIDGGSF